MDAETIKLIGSCGRPKLVTVDATRSVPTPLPISKMAGTFTRTSCAASMAAISVWSKNPGILARNRQFESLVDQSGGVAIGSAGLSLKSRHAAALENLVARNERSHLLHWSEGSMHIDDSAADNHLVADAATGYDAAARSAKNLKLRVSANERYFDQSALASEQGEGTHRVVAGRAQDGSFVIISTPVGQPLSIHMDKLDAPRINARWYDPRNGPWKSIGQYPQEAPRREEDQPSAEFTHAGSP